MSSLIAPLIFCLAAVYLAARLVRLWLRVHRSRRVYPVPQRAPAPAWSRVYGALLGLAVGDSLGLPAEQLPTWLVRLRFPKGPRLRSGWLRCMRRAGDISDDTQLSIAVARSILPEGRYDHLRFRDELGAWYEFRVAAGRATSRAARRLWRDRHCAAAPAESEGNGVAIRIAPLALALEDDDELLRNVECNASETHAPEMAIAAARLVALFVHRARHFGVGQLPRGAQYDAFVEALALRSGFPLDRYRAALNAGSLRAGLRVCGTSAHALESVTAVLLIVRTHPADFRAAMHAAFWAGGDTDSIGSMVGAILGSNLCAEAIPPEWRDVAPQAYLAELARRFPAATHRGPHATGGSTRPSATRRDRSAVRAARAHTALSRHVRAARPT